MVVALSPALETRVRVAPVVLKRGSGLRGNVVRVRANSGNSTHHWPHVVVWVWHRSGTVTGADEWNSRCPVSKKYNSEKNGPEFHLWNMFRTSPVSSEISKTTWFLIKFDWKKFPELRRLPHWSWLKTDTTKNMYVCALRSFQETPSQNVNAWNRNKNFRNSHIFNFSDSACGSTVRNYS